MEGRLRNGVAFIHRGAWGDLYVSLAALKSATDEHPLAPLFVVGSAKWCDLLEPTSWPQLKEIWVSENGRRADVHSWSASEKKWQKTASDVALTRLMKKIKTSYNTRTESLRYAWAPLLARVSERHGSAPSPWGRLVYTHRAPWLGKDPIIHERDRMLQVVEAPDRLGTLARFWQPRGLPAPKIPNPARAQELTRASFGHYWLINPTASRREKAWPAENYRKLFSLLKPKLAAAGIELRLIGAPNETAWLKEVLPLELQNDADFATHVVQPPRILDLVDVLAGAKLLVTNTSSLQFLAPGVNVPVMTLMGRGQPEIWGPLGPHDQVIRGTVDRRLDADIFAQEQAAYASISFEQVLHECLAHLAVSQKVP